MAFVTVGKTSDIPPGAGAQLEISGKKIAVFNCDGDFYAIDDTCTHRGGPLSEGLVVGEEVECPWHGARFNLKSGAHLCPPAPRGVTAYPVQVVGEEVRIDLP
jgi:nitrite reductase/ring-hydroxylating ferredoxin subunit